MRYYTSWPVREDIRKYLDSSEDTTITKSLRFQDGCQMDVKWCGVRDPSDTPWTEAVLFDKEGRELTYSEPSEDYFGEWVLEYNGNEYHGFIEKDLTPKRINEIAHIEKQWYAAPNEMVWHNAETDPPKQGQIVLVSGWYNTYRYYDGLYYCTDWESYGQTPNLVRWWMPLPIPASKG